MLKLGLSGTERLEGSGKTLGVLGARSKTKGWKLPGKGFGSIKSNGSVIDTDNSVVMTRGEGRGEVEEGIGG